MPKGRLMRAEEFTSEQTSVRARKEGGRGMLDALTAEDGPLPTGACPALMAASTEGQKAIIQALDDDKKSVKLKPKPKKAPKNTAEGTDVVPKTLQESWTQ